MQSPQSGKTSGPGGLGPEFYKTFAELEANPHLHMYIKSFEKGSHLLLFMQQIYL